MKQRDNEIGILLNYLNKVKEKGGANGNTDLPISRAEQPSAEKPGLEETKQGGGGGGEPTLFQMMQSKQQNTMQKSIKEKRIEFELNRSANDASRPAQGLSKELEEV